MKGYSFIVSLCLVVLAFAGNVFAAAWTGYSTVATSVSDELTGALAVIAALLAITIGVPLGIRLFRRIVK